MAVPPLRFSRRCLLLSPIAARVLARGAAGAAFPSDWRHYSDPATELDVYRLTDPAYSSTLPAYFNRVLSRNGAFLLFCCDRTGSLEAFRMDLQHGGTTQLTQAQDLDGDSLTLLPDGRSFCYFAGRSLWLANLANLRAREVYTLAASVERAGGMSAEPDGMHATFAERSEGVWRLRRASLVRGPAATIVEARTPIADPIARPRRAQILYRQGDEALWLVNTDGSQRRRLELAPGRVGPGNWAPDGRTILYLNLPDDPTQLNAIREYAPDQNTDKLVAKTSQFVHFGFNRDTSVFVGASRNAASPVVLILLRATRRELTLCEHRASHPETVAPRFSPDSQRVYFQSDRHGKSAIYCMPIEKLVEKTAEEGDTH